MKFHYNLVDTSIVRSITMNKNLALVFFLLLVLHTAFVSAMVTKGWEERILVSDPGNPYFFTQYYGISIASRPSIIYPLREDKQIIAWRDNRLVSGPSWCQPPNPCYDDLFAMILKLDGEPATVPIRISSRTGLDAGLSLDALADDERYYLVYGEQGSYRLPDTKIAFAVLSPNGEIIARQTLTNNNYPISYPLIKATLLSGQRIAILAEKYDWSTYTPYMVFLVIDTNGNIIQPERVLPIPFLYPFTALGSYLMPITSDPSGNIYTVFTHADSVPSCNTWGGCPYVLSLTSAGEIRYLVPLVPRPSGVRAYSLLYDNNRLHISWGQMDYPFNLVAVYGQRDAATGLPIPGISDYLAADPFSSFSEGSYIKLDGSRIELFYSLIAYSGPPEINSIYLVGLDKNTGRPLHPPTLVGDLESIPVHTAYNLANDLALGRRSILSAQRTLSYLPHTNIISQVVSVPAITPAGPLRAGTQTRIDVDYPRRPGVQAYLATTFSSTPGIPLPDGRTIPLNTNDPLFQFSHALLQPQSIQLDEGGHGQTTLYIPNGAPSGTYFNIVVVLYNSEEGIVDFSLRSLSVAP